MGARVITGRANEVFLGESNQQPEVEMKLEITKERVLEAAASCGAAKEVLEKLFPEAFVTPAVDTRKFYFKPNMGSGWHLMDEDRHVLSPSSSDYSRLYLDGEYHFEIQRDATATFLKITRKG